VIRFFQRRASAEKAARTPTWLAASPEAATLTGHYLDGKKRTRPAVATDPGNQQRVTDLAHQLIRNAPTSAPHTPPHRHSQGFVEPSRWVTTATTWPDMTASMTRAGVP
jgi:hypothetical protein